MLKEWTKGIGEVSRPGKSKAVVVASDEQWLAAADPLDGCYKCYHISCICFCCCCYSTVNTGFFGVDREEEREEEGKKVEVE